ncbi:MAG TPA: family 20 glycosylhydrolase [Terriglobales bacterium]|nr:family 20 glycosylhydrolase [Terriglobales bacterium]
MPWPQKIQMGSGQLLIANPFSVALTGYTEVRLDHAVARMVGNLSRQTGIPLQTLTAQAANATLVIHVDHASDAVQKLGEDESYQLTVTPNQVKLNAPNPLGIIRGLQTFLQLVQNTPQGFAAPAVQIDDSPRFPWRGLMLDVCRHWQPIDVVYRTLDGMEAVKMNVFHWHLSENQGFRIESKKFPKLQGMGSDGNYYTQAQVKEVIEYARDRGIRVVPEFDMPGHTTAWFVGYPELASAPGPYSIERGWGVFDPAMDPTREETYKFLEEFIHEMAGVFPDQFFHIGGDEVNGKQWNANQKIQAFMKAHNIKSNDELQAYFNKRVEGIVEKNHKTMIGWDEILNPDLPKSIVIQSWRGQKSLAAAAQQGYRGLLSSGYYLDLMQTAAQHYAVDPLTGPSANLTPEQTQRILGGEACMWTEWVSPENVDNRIWPRNVAIAERLWSPADVHDVNSMYRRMYAVSDELAWLGLKHQSNPWKMLERLSAAQEVPSVKILADAVEPVKGYERERTQKYTQFTPLNRLIDSTYPESQVGHTLTLLTDTVITGQASAADKAQIRSIFTAWRDNDARLQPVLQNSFLLNDVAPVSRDLSTLGATGLQALDYLDSGSPSPDSWRAQQSAFLDQAAQHRGEVVLVGVAPIRKLVDATAQARNASGVSK